MDIKTTKEEIQEIKKMLDKFNYEEDKGEIRAIFLITSTMLEKKRGYINE